MSENLDTSRPNNVRVEERELLQDGNCPNLLIEQENKQALLFGTIGESNLKIFSVIKTGASSISDDVRYGDPEEEIRHLHEIEQYRRVLLSREIAVRSIEMCMETPDNLGDVSAGMTRLTSGTPYDKKRIFGSGVPSTRHLRKSLQRAHEAGWSLADALTQMRLREDELLMLGTFIFNTHYNSLDHYVGSVKGGRRKLIKSKALGEERDQIRRADIDLSVVVNHLRATDWRKRPQDYERLSGLIDIAETLHGRRATPEVNALYTQDDSQYIYVPSNMEVYSNHVSTTPKERTPAIRSLSPEQLAEVQAARLAGEAERRAAQEAMERQRAEEEALRDEHDAPILERLNQIADSYNDIIYSYVGQSSRQLRDIAIVGKDSLLFELSKQKKLGVDNPERVCRVYDRLRTLVIEDGDMAFETLTKQLQELEQLSVQFIEYETTHRLHGTRPSRRPNESIKAELAWLSQNWNVFKAVLLQSTHRHYVPPGLLGALEELIGVDSSLETQTGSGEGSTGGAGDQTEEVIDEPEPSAPDQEPGHDVGALEDGKPDRQSPLVIANRLAEQLSWIVLPTEPITVDDLVTLAKSVIDKRNPRRRTKAEVEKERMAALLQLRDDFGGELYRSDERTLGDHDNLYFVLRFRHPGDDNYYAVAENPVYGNATYVLRENVLPLQPGETVLAALRLARREIGYFGAKRIIHSMKDMDIHLEKVKDALVTLSEADPVR